jgi:hypothetical protein
MSVVEEQVPERETRTRFRVPAGARWHLHPGVRSGEQLTLGERAADAMRNGMGS